MFAEDIPKLSHMPWVAPAQEHLGTRQGASPVPALQESCRGKGPGQVPSFLQLLLGWQPSVLGSKGTSTPACAHSTCLAQMGQAVT